MTNIDQIFEAQKYIEPDEELKGDTGYYGMVSSAVKEATEAGNEMLKQGGNAFDAIIAVQLALSVVEGMNTGIGAGGFILCHDYENKDTKVINAHPRSPAALRRDCFIDENGEEISFDERSTHFTAVDQWGNVAACTTSIERIYCSGIMVPGYGFLLNNHLTDFSTEPGSINEPNGNKYPKSSKSPTILFHDGKPFFTLGSPGAATIIASVVQTIVNVIDYNMPIDEAIKDQRVYVMPDLSKQWEDGLNNDVLEELSEMGYQFNQTFREEGADTRIGDVQAIMIEHANDRRLYGGADFPRPGDAKGL